MDDVLKGIIGLSVLVVLGGIIGAAISGSDRAFDLQPILTVFRAKSPPLPHGGPQIQGAAPTAIAPPTNEELLATCPSGSVDLQVAEVPFEQAQAVQQQVEAGQQFQDLIEVQGALGHPKCNFFIETTRHYFYLVTSGKAIDAAQSGDQAVVNMTFLHF